MTATTIQLRRKGVLTLPASLRRKYGFQENDVFTLQDLGDGSFLLVPQLSQVARQGDRVAALMKEQEVSVEEMPAHIARIGLRDVFPESGLPEPLLDKYHIGVQDIVDAAKKMINKK